MLPSVSCNANAGTNTSRALNTGRASNTGRGSDVIVLMEAGASIRVNMVFYARNTAKQVVKVI